MHLSLLLERLNNSSCLSAIWISKFVSLCIFYFNSRTSWVVLFIASFPFFLISFLKYLFIWLCQVLASAFRLFHCVMWILSFGMWDLVPLPGTEPRPLALGAWILATEPQGKFLLISFIRNWSNQPFTRKKKKKKQQFGFL